MVNRLRSGLQSDLYSKDLFFTSNGDFRLGENKELETTTSSEQRLLLQTILKLMSSSPGDWPMAKEMGVGLARFLGMPNTKATATEMKDRIMSEFNRNDLLRRCNPSVVIVPAAQNAVAIIVLAKHPDSTQPVAVQFSYDMRDNKLIARNL
jgi:hypothetical protein